VYLCNFNRIYSIRDFNRIYSIRDFIQSTKMYQITRHRKNKKKKNPKQLDITCYLLHSIIFLVTQIDLVVLDSHPWGTWFWLRTEITCPSAPRPSGIVVHMHIRITFLNGTIAFDSMPCHSRFNFLLLTLFF